MQLCQDKQVSDFQPLVRKQCKFPGSRAALCMGWAPCFPQLGQVAASRWRSWLIFQVRKAHLIFWWLLHQCIVLGVCDQSQHRKGFSDSLQSLMLKWWILGLRNETRTFHCLQLWAPVSGAALVDKHCVCMSSFAPSDTPLFIVCIGCRMFWAYQSAPDVVVIGQNSDTWERKKSINLDLKRIHFSWVNCLWRQKVTAHVGGPASCLAMSFWRDVSSQTDHPPSPVPSSSPQLLQKFSK